MNESIAADRAESRDGSGTLQVCAYDDNSQRLDVWADGPTARTARLTGDACSNWTVAQGRYLVGYNRPSRECGALKLRVLRDETLIYERGTLSGPYSAEALLPATVNVARGAATKVEIVRDCQ